MLHQEQHCTCNTFCEKPNVTRSSMFFKSYYKIMVICGQSLLNAFINEPIKSIIFYRKLINSAKLKLKTCILWYICKMSHCFYQKAVNLAYFTENLKKNVKVNSTSNYILMVNLGMDNKIMDKYW